MTDDDLRYCLTDTLLLGALFSTQWAAMTEKQRYALRLELEMQLLVAGITYRGLAVDQGRLRAAREHYQASLAEPEAEIRALLPGVKTGASGRLTDPSLCKQIAATYGIDPASAEWSRQNDRKRQKRGKAPLGECILVSEEVLREVELEDYAWKEVAIPLRRYKKATSLVTRLTEDYLQVHEGRCYPRILSLATRNLRMTAKDPNLHQHAAGHRDVIVADEGEVFVSADLSQIETRIGAVASADALLLQATQAEDIYVAIAAILFQIGYEMLLMHPRKEELRKSAKIIVLALQYGGGWRVVRKQMHKNEQRCTPQEARDKAQHYLTTFAGIGAMVQRAYDEPGRCRR
jgi:DNA polymerase I-like protein with 3'-5' exonuclease and polymerase domains